MIVAFRPVRPTRHCRYVSRARGPLGAVRQSQGNSTKVAGVED